MLSFVLSARLPGARVGAFAAYALVTLGLTMLPLHAAAIASAEAGLTQTGPPFNSTSCSQTSAGAVVQCDLSSPFSVDDSGQAISSASASFGDLSVAATAGSNNYNAGSQASASFSSDVMFSQAGTITGTWLITYQAGGDEGIWFPEITIMGTAVPVCTVNCGGEGGSVEGQFSISIPFTYSGGPLAVSAALFDFASGPGGEGGSASIQLVGFSNDYTMMPDAPEPGTLWLTGMALPALAFFRRKRAGIRRRPSV